MLFQRAGSQGVVNLDLIINKVGLDYNLIESREHKIRFYFEEFEKNNNI